MCPSLLKRGGIHSTVILFLVHFKEVEIIIFSRLTIEFILLTRYMYNLYTLGLLDDLKSPNFNLITNKSFHFSTLYTTIPHQKLKSRLATTVMNTFVHKNGNRRYKYLVLGRERPYFVREHSDSKSKNIIRMLEFLVDNIFVVFAGTFF